MDHHILPDDPSPVEIRVPCVCLESYFDGQSFLTYPEENGKTWLLPEEGVNLRVKIQSYEHKYPTPVREQERFYQSWLFFGLLQAFL